MTRRGGFPFAKYAIQRSWKCRPGQQEQRNRQKPKTRQGSTDRMADLELPKGPHSELAVPARWVIRFKALREVSWKRTDRLGTLQSKENKGSTKTGKVFSFLIPWPCRGQAGGVRGPCSRPHAIYPSIPPSKVKAQNTSQAWTPWQKVRTEA